MDPQLCAAGFHGAPDGHEILPRTHIFGTGCANCRAAQRRVEDIIKTRGVHGGGMPIDAAGGMVASGDVSGAPVGDNDDIWALAELAAVEIDPAC